MKKLAIVISAVMCCTLLQAQTAEQFKAKYVHQVNAMGYAGLGVETILNKWEAAFPDDVDMMMGKFCFFLAKSQTSEVVAKDQDKFLGEKPVLSIPDSTGHRTNWFQENFYDEEYFAQCIEYIDKAIATAPNELGYRENKISALQSYEKESPDLASAELVALVDYNTENHPEWTLNAMPIDEDVFYSAIQEYCYEFYTIGSPASYECFRSISEKMLPIAPNETCFLTNIGTYWLVAQKNDKKALKYYKKALKINPDEESAKANIALIEKRKAAAKKK